MASPVIILGADGTPQPPQDILRRLRAVDPRLSLKHFPHVEKAWAVMLAWAENDSRWMDVRIGKVDPADTFDIIGFLPSDCSLSEAPAYINRFFGTFPRADVTKLLQQMDRWNETSEGAIEAQEEVLADLTAAKFGVDAAKATGKRVRHKVPRTV